VWGPRLMRGSSSAISTRDVSQAVMPHQRSIPLRRNTADRTTRPMTVEADTRLVGDKESSNGLWPYTPGSTQAPVRRPARLSH
jgi:hypothetical protein